MKTATQWEIVRHQVALFGRVIDESDKPVAGVQVNITSMPKDLTEKIAVAANSLGSEWEERVERLDRTVSRKDGLFYFLDLPNGQYKLKALDLCSGSQDETKMLVSRKKDGRIKAGVADLRLSGSS